MKKNRPGVLLTVLCEPDAVERMADVIFRETTSFGLRLSEKRRLKLDRHGSRPCETAHGEIQVKLGFDAHGTLLQVAPEYESCRAAAERAGVALREVYAAANCVPGQRLAQSPPRRQGEDENRFSSFAALADLRMALHRREMKTARTVLG